MTIVAYKDGILAADTLVTEPDFYFKAYYAKKIIKTPDGCLAGAHGYTDYCQKFLEWSCTDRSLPAPKATKNDGSDGGLLILPNKEIRLYTGATYDILLDKEVAIGAGAQIAYGVFWMKGSAVDAVKAAISRNMTCGGKIQTLRL